MLSLHGSDVLYSAKQKKNLHFQMRAMELFSVFNYSLGEEKTEFGTAVRVTNSLPFSSPEAFLTIFAM